MKPRRTHTSSGVLRLPGASEDSDLWYEHVQDDEGHHAFETVWQPNNRERELLVEGACVRLVVWGEGHPPVAMGVTQVSLGRPPRDTQA